MELTERQNLILENIVRDYIDLAKPLSSELLEKKHKFGLSPATLRIEMQKLTDRGYLIQPHTSSGRVPTDKGYRFFVDNLLKKEKADPVKDFGLGDFFPKEIGSIFEFTARLTKILAQTSEDLAVSHFCGGNFLWKEGWERLLREPEFENKNSFFDFTDFLEDFEENIEDFKVDSGINIFIGEESNFSRAKNFSIIAGGCLLSTGGRLHFAILGPKRMDYGKNIGLINYLKEALNNF